MTTRIITELAGQRWLDVYNPSNEIIRPFACVQLSIAKFPQEYSLPNTLTRAVFLARTPTDVLFPFEGSHDLAWDNRSFSRGGNEYGFNSELAILPQTAGKITLNCPTFALVHDASCGGFVEGWDDENTTFQYRAVYPCAGKQWLECRRLPNADAFGDFEQVDFIGAFVIIKKIQETVIPRVCGDASVCMIQRASCSEDWS